MACSLSKRIDCQPQFSLFLLQYQSLSGNYLLPAPATLKTGKSRAGGPLSFSPEPPRAFFYPRSNLPRLWRGFSNKPFVSNKSLVILATIVAGKKRNSPCQVPKFADPNLCVGRPHLLAGIAGKGNGLSPKVRSLSRPIGGNQKAGNQKTKRKPERKPGTETGASAVRGGAGPRIGFGFGYHSTPVVAVIWPSSPGFLSRLSRGWTSLSRSTCCSRAGQDRPGSSSQWRTHVVHGLRESGRPTRLSLSFRK